MKSTARSRVEYHIEEYGKMKDRSKFISQPGIWPRVEPCLDIIRDERERKGRELRILDLGCNDGTVSKLIGDMGNEVHGVDVIPRHVESANKKGIKAVVCDIEDGLPYEDDFFDIVYAGVLLEHIFDTDALLKEAGRVLMREGLLIVSVPNICSFPNRIRIMFGLYPKFIAPAPSWRLGGHVRAFTAGALAKVFENNGFKTEKLVGNFVSFFPTFQTSRPWSRLLGRALPRLSEVLIASARKI